MNIHDIMIGDEVFVNCPARHIEDARPICGAATVMGVWPNHICGPCLQVRDDDGLACIPWDCCLPLSLGGEALLK